MHPFQRTTAFELTSIFLNNNLELYWNVLGKLEIFIKYIVINVIYALFI